MKAWRFYGFEDMRLDEVPRPECRPGHVVVQVLCVQPSVTEAQLAFGIRTLAYEKIKHRLETEAPVQLFGHEFCARIIEIGDGVTRVQPGDRVAARAKLPCGDLPALRRRPRLPLPQRPDHRLSASRLFLRIRPASGNRAW